MKRSLLLFSTWMLFTPSAIKETPKTYRIAIKFTCGESIFIAVPPETGLKVLTAEDVESAIKCLEPHQSCTIETVYYNNKKQ